MDPSALRCDPTSQQETYAQYSLQPDSSWGQQSYQYQSNISYSVPSQASSPVIHKPIPSYVSPAVFTECSESMHLKTAGSVFNYPPPPGPPPPMVHPFPSSTDINTHVQTFPTPSDLLRTQTSFSSQQFQDNYLLEFSGPNRNVMESQRKSRRRDFLRLFTKPTTDPDTISSHDKKRHYLESLEHYILYLHDQLHLVGAKPITLDRVQSYQGLSSRSIRTLLVHMENTSRKLNTKISSEEQRFIQLKEAAIRLGIMHDDSIDSKPSSRLTATHLDSVPLFSESSWNL